MASLGCISNIVFSIISISVSPKNIIFSLLIPNLSALNLTCSADSSPETYNTLPFPCTLLHSCRIRVDLPIPGSPPRSTNEPFTNPPPNTLFNSPIPVLILIVSFPSTLFNCRGVTFFFSAFPPPLTLLLIFSS